MVFLIDYLAAGVVDSAGDPMTNGTVDFYDAGTTTRVTMYQERELTNPLPNPATLDSAGRLIAFHDSRLKLVVTKTDLSEQVTIDNIGIGSGDIQAGDIADGAVATINLPDGAVTEAKIADAAVTTAKILDASVTAAKRSALGQQVSTTTGAGAQLSNTSYADVTNLTVTITTTGRPVFIGLQADGSANAAYLHAQPGTIDLKFVRVLSGTPTDIAISKMGANTSTTLDLPPSALWFIDQVAAGTYTYKLQNKVIGAATINFNYTVLFAYEIN